MGAFYAHSWYSTYVEIYPRWSEVTVMRQFKLAFIGCGGISQAHLGSYGAHGDRVKLVATCDVLPERAEQAKADYGAEAAFVSVEDTIAGADWDVAVVCTPTPVRQEVVEPLARAGKHIYIEKPLADTIGEARRMVDLCNDASVLMAVDQTYRYYYPFNIARRLIAEGRIGRPISVVHRGLDFRQDAGWRTECKRHTLAVMGVHWVDGFRWMLQSEAAEVRAMSYSSDAIDCVGETDAHVQIRFDNGTAVSYVQSFSSLPGVVADTIITGDGGTLHLDYGGATLYAQGRQDIPVDYWPIEVKDNPHRWAVYRLLEELLDAIDTGQQPANNCMDNLKTIALLEAAWRSADTGQAMTLTGGLL
jgi:predicted dehydrogenase